MTRGQEQWKRVVLEAIADKDCAIFPILNIARSHLGHEATSSEAQAARKAVEQLVIARKVSPARVMGPV